MPSEITLRCSVAPADKVTASFQGSEVWIDVKERGEKNTVLLSGADAKTLTAALIAAGFGPDGPGETQRGTQAIADADRGRSMEVARR